MRLHHCRDARSLRVVWTLEEIGLLDGSFAHENNGYELITLPFPPRALHRPFMKQNMLGTVPLFEHSPDTGAAAAAGAPRLLGEATAMTESCAIPLWLLSQYRGGVSAVASLGVDPHEPDYHEFLNWLFHADATLTFPQTVVLRYTLQEPGRADHAAVDYARWYLARLRKLDAALADGREYLVADRFTVADICVTYALFIGTTLQLEDAPIATRYKPQTGAYLEPMMARPGWLAAQAAQERGEEAFERIAQAPSGEDGGGGGQQRSKL